MARKVFEMAFRGDCPPYRFRPLVVCSMAGGTNPRYDQAQIVGRTRLTPTVQDCAWPRSTHTSCGSSSGHRSRGSLPFSSIQFSINLRCSTTSPRFPSTLFQFTISTRSTSSRSSDTSSRQSGSCISKIHVPPRTVWSGFCFTSGSWTTSVSVIRSGTKMTYRLSQIQWNRLHSVGSCTSWGWTPIRPTLSTFWLASRLRSNGSRLSAASCHPLLSTGS